MKFDIFWPGVLCAATIGGAVYGTKGALLLTAMYVLGALVDMVKRRPR